MSRELKLVTWCDGDHDGDVSATVVRTLTVDGSKPVLLDLCEVCDKIVEDLLVFMERGVQANKALVASGRVRKQLPTRAPERTRTVPEQAVPTRADGRDRVDCPECDYVARTRGALGQHLRSRHSKTTTDYDWTPTAG